MNSLEEFKISGKKINPQERQLLAEEGYKWCSKCKSAKLFSEFAKNSRNSDGYNGHCKDCKRQYRLDNLDRFVKKDRDRYWNNPEKFREQRKQYIKDNYSKVKQSKKDYYNRNRSKILAKNNEYRLANLDKIKAKQQEYHTANNEYRNLANKLYRNNNSEVINNRIRYRYNNDINFRLKCICRQLIRRAYLSIGTKKESATEKLLGYSPIELKEHLEAQFKLGMSWDNYGEWHIDHIIPISRAINLEEGLELSKLENLQPLWADENILKSNNQ